MKRSQDWPSRLDAFLSEAGSSAFTWGSWDCCTFAARAVIAMTGEDPRGARLPTYTDAPGALRALKRRGGTIPAMVEAMAKRYGWSEIAPRRAQRGDAVLLDPTVDGLEAFGGTLGICLGRHIAVMSELGLAALPLDDALRAWRI